MDFSKNILLIDSSYYNFYRFSATKSWYNRSPERIQEGENLKWLDNSTYMKTYEKMWFETLKKLSKMFNPDHIIFARDGNDVWRYKLYPEYKATRPVVTTSQNNGPGPVFKHTNKYFHPKVQNSTTIRIPEAEGDDIIAVAAEYYKSLGYRVTIITGDKDLLQISDVQIYNLKGKKFTNITSDNPYQSKMIKILAGDPSDNLKNSFPKCGKKTAIKLMNDESLLQKWKDKYGDQRYKLNCLLIDFQNIPELLKQDIINQLKCCNL